VRILFMGTPDFAAEILKTLHAEEEIVGVFTQPGKPKGRGHNVTPSAVQQLAEELAIPCYTPASLKNGAVDDLLKELAPELSVVVAYGKILPKDVLEYPKYGSVNIHASILPRFRGAAPIQRAIIAGDSETGVTVQQMDEGIDTGDMLVIEKVAIDPEDDFGTLHDKLAEAGKLAIVETIKQIKDKLKQCFYPEEIIEETISFLCKYNYLNDERYCVNYINSKKSVKSIRQITAELYNKGISPEFVKNILQNEEYDISLDSSECIYKLLKKKSFDSKNEDYSYKSKILAYVVSKGFDFDDVISVMSKFDRYD